MQTRRDYLVSLGLAKAGRGKFSRDALAALDKARAGGMTFSDEEAKAVAVKVKAAKKERKASEPEESQNNYADARLFVSSLDEEFVGEDSSGKRVVVTARAACYDGRYSIAGCPQRTHRVLVGGGEIVTVRPKGE